MPTNRELLIAQRKKERGLPFSPSDLSTPFTLGKKPPKGDPRFTITEDTVLRQDLEKQQGITPTPFPLLGPIREESPEPRKKLALKTTVDSIDKQQANEFRGTGLEGLKAGEGRASSRIDPGPLQKRTRGGFASFSPQKGLPGAASSGRASSFGLPTDRLPSFAELGGAIGQMFKFVGGLTKKRQALGLIPGRVGTPTQAKGLSLTTKDRAGILQKRREAAFLANDTEKVNKIDAELDKLLNPEEASDIEAILNE